MTDDAIDDCAASAAEIEAHDKRIAEMDGQIEDLQRQGWNWSEDDRIKRLLIHPDDPDVNIWFHPYTGESLLSPKLQQRLKEAIVARGNSSTGNC
jgi:hypothetical protein